MTRALLAESRRERPRCRQVSYQKTLTVHGERKLIFPQREPEPETGPHWRARSPFVPRSRLAAFPGPSSNLDP
jgi:hypothetical protein